MAANLALSETKIKHPTADPLAQTVTCVPTSTTRPLGIWK